MDIRDKRVDFLVLLRRSFAGKNQNSPTMGSDS